NQGVVLVGHAGEAAEGIVGAVLDVAVLVGAPGAPAGGVVGEREELAAGVVDARQQVRVGVVGHRGRAGRVLCGKQVSGGVVGVDIFEAHLGRVVLARDLAGGVVGVGELLPSAVGRGQDVAPGVVRVVLVGAVRVGDRSQVAARVVSVSQG